MPGSGFKNFQNGDVLPESEIDGYLMKQAVMYFADATARDAAISAPEEGMHAYLADTDTLTFYDGSAWAIRGHQPGDLKLTARSSAPTGWLLCDGSAVSRTTYAALFAAIGTTYGVGDGSTTFNLPDLQTRVPVGASGSGDYTLGNTGGAETVALTESEIPSHTHVFDAGTSAGSDAPGLDALFEESFPTSETGSGNAHENRPPFLVINFVIKT